MKKYEDHIIRLETSEGVTELRKLKNNKGSELFHYNFDNKLMAEETFNNNYQSHGQHFSYFENGNISVITHYRNSKRHNETGPAVVKFYDNFHNTIRRTEYRIMDKLHRKDGPARIEYDTKGEITNIEYWIYGKQISEMQWLVIKGEIDSYTEN